MIEQSIVSLARTTDYGLRTTDYGLRTTDYGLRTTDYGLRIVKCLYKQSIRAAKAIEEESELGFYGIVVLCVVIVLATPALLVLVYYSWRNGISPMPASARVRRTMSEQVSLAAERIIQLQQDKIDTITQQIPQISRQIATEVEPDKAQSVWSTSHSSATDSLALFTDSMISSARPIESKSSPPVEPLSRTTSETPLQIIEAGSGWGTLALHIMQNNPNVRITGIENSPLPLCCSRVLSRWKRTNIQFQQGDIYLYPYEQADIVVCYLFPGAMRKLRPILEQRSRPHTYVISACFAVPEWEPEQVVLCSDWYHTPVYVYRCGHRSYLA